MEGEEEEGEGVGVVVVGVAVVAEDPPILQEDGAPPEDLTPIPADQQQPTIHLSHPLAKVTETIFASTEIFKSVGSVATDHLPP